MEKKVKMISTKVSWNVSQKGRSNDLFNITKGKHFIEPDDLKYINSIQVWFEENEFNIISLEIFPNMNEWRILNNKTLFHSFVYSVEKDFLDEFEEEVNKKLIRKD